MKPSVPGPPSGDAAKFQRNPSAMAWSQNGQQHLRHGRYEAALAIYRDLVRRFPGVPQLWANLGVAAAGHLEFSLAGQALQRATTLAPSDPALLVFVATQYYQLRQLDQAFTCLKSAVAADPASIKLRLMLLSWLEQTRRLDEAWECVETCLADHPGNVEALYCRAYLLQRRGLSAEAEAAVRNLLKNDSSLTPELRFNAYHLLGNVLDALEQYGEALNWLGQAKALQRQISGAARLEEHYEVMDQRRRALLASLTPDTVRRWRDEPPAAPSAPRLALLGGAPRSGTTLLEQILGAHPGIIAFGESSSFERELLEHLQPRPPATALTLKSLDDLATAGRNRLCGRYFKSLRRETPEPPAAKLFIDKNPSLTAMLPAWLRLFPHSKIIIALRDPRDVIISSYFQNLTVVLGNVHFLTLEGTARFYSDCMDTWLRLRELGGFDWIETRYESVVDNMEAEGRRVMGFLDLPWDEAQTTYYKTAREKFVHSPTYHEVAKPVHNQAVGRWKHYAGALAPLQAVIGKYCEAFGYA